MIPCPWCNKSFGGVYRLQHHIKFTHDFAERKCDICDQTFSHSKILEVHMQEAHLRTFNFYCKLCQEGFVLRNEYDHHKETVHQPRKACKVCNQFFDSTRSLKVHMDTHMKTKSKFEECQICHQLVKDLERHYFQSHTDEKRVICDICGKSFRETATLKLHLMIHKNIRPFVCEICGFKFLTKQKLTVHMRQHTGEKPYCCEVCEKSFTRRGGLVQHFRIHSGEKPYSCQHCDDTFSRKWYLTRHIKSTHKDI